MSGSPSVGGRGVPGSVLIVMMSALGDAVHVLPVANAMKRAWPDTRLSWLIQPTAHRLVRTHPAVDEFIVFRRRRGPGAWRAFVEVAPSLRRHRFDLLLALQVYAKAGLLTALARADVKLGFDRARARDLNWLVTNRRIPAHPVQHVQDQYFEFLHALGVDPEPVEWGLELTAEERARQSSFYSQVGGRVCAVVLGTSKPEKDWFPDRYAAVVDGLERRWGMRAVFVGGPGPAERAMADAVARRTTAEPIDMLGDDVRRLVWLLDGADLVISPDTGPLHIARALERPVVGLYGYTNPKRAGPYRKYGDLVVDGYARQPGEAYPPSTEYRPGGMARVTVQAVMDRVERAMSRYVR